MSRKELTKHIREFFRKRREYMNGRIDTALHTHLGDTEIDSVEAMNTVMEFVGRNTEVIDGIRARAQIDIEEEEAAREFVRERVFKSIDFTKHLFFVGCDLLEEAVGSVEKVQECRQYQHFHLQYLHWCT
jgi:hypothetical protein